jgi:phage shock protein A
MSLFRRMSLVFQQKANAALDKAEDPNQALDLSYQKMLENLQKVRQSIAEVLTAEKRLEQQRDGLAAQATKLQGQARQALSMGQEDLARTALARAQVVNGQIESLMPQIESLKSQEQQLEVTGQKLTAKIAAFRSQRDTMKAQYSAAKATTKAVEGVTGLSEQMADVSLMLDRAQDKVQSMQARAAAVGQLADSGALDSIDLGGGTDDIDAQLRQLGDHHAVDAQLEALKAELGAGTEPAAELGAGSDFMVVRIVHAEQYRVPASLQPQLEDLDKRLVAAIEQDSSSAFTGALHELLELVKSKGQALPDDELRPSALIVPGENMSLQEAKQALEAGE